MWWNAERLFFFCIHSLFKKTLIIDPFRAVFVSGLCRVSSHPHRLTVPLDPLHLHLGIDIPLFKHNNPLYISSQSFLLIHLSMRKTFQDIINFCWINNLKRWNGDYILTELSLWQFALLVAVICCLTVSSQQVQTCRSIRCTVSTVLCHIGPSHPDFNYTPPRMLQLSGAEFAAPVSTRYPFAESTFFESQ